MAYGVYDITLWYLEQALKVLQRLEQATAASTSSPPLRGLLAAEISIRWLPTCGEAVGARYVLLAAPDLLAALTLLFHLQIRAGPDVPTRGLLLRRHGRGAAGDMSAREEVTRPVRSFLRCGYERELHTVATVSCSGM